MYFAHSENPQGDLHPLKDHLLEVARLARGYGDKFGAGEFAYWAGLWHDLGKFTDAFQDYIKDPSSRPRGPDHSSAGAVHAAFRSAAAGSEAQLLSFLVAGHHSGIPNQSDLEDRLVKARSDARVAEALERAARNLDSLTPSADLSQTLPEFVSSPRDRRTWDLFLRMVFSALKDADFLDTEAHFNPDRRAERRAYTTLEHLWERFQEHHAKLAAGAKDTTVNQIRNQVYQACLLAAVQPQGIFRLTVPTGGGKTLSSMAFALRHALHHGLDRIIVAIPYTSIIEQTASVYREAFGDDAVLEHHSDVPWPDDSQDLTPRHVWARLASENWDAPVIVTTTVQLFDSLFSNRTTACRKLHNIARSVVILDEVQTLPTELLDPILDVIQQLADNYRVTFVLSSATLPAFQQSPYTRGLRHKGEIIPEPGRLFGVLKRVSYNVRPAGEIWSWERVAEEMRKSSQCMAVVNTRRDAMRLLNALDGTDALHLSTLLYGAHRRRVLQEIRRRLGSGEPCRLVATQVVEAGVDLDFPVVLRAIGPLDRIVQAAGRCNREGKADMGRVIVFEPEEGRLPPGAYKSGTDCARTILASGELDLDTPRVHQLYFSRLFRNVEPDPKKIQASRSRLDFEDVARKFRLIDDDTRPVVVAKMQDEETVRRLIGQLTSGYGSPRNIMRSLGPYLLNMRDGEIPRLEQQGLVGRLTESLWQWLGDYDEVRGIGYGSLDPDALVVA